jgi:hypothetical protein
VSFDIFLGSFEQREAAKTGLRGFGSSSCPLIVAPGPELGARYVGWHRRRRQTRPHRYEPDGQLRPGHDDVPGVVAHTSEQARHRLDPLFPDACGRRAFPRRESPRSDGRSRLFAQTTSPTASSDCRSATVPRSRRARRGLDACPDRPHELVWSPGPLRERQPTNDHAHRRPARVAH